MADAFDRALRWADEMPPIRFANGRNDLLSHRILFRLALIADERGLPTSMVSEPPGMAESLGVDRQEIDRAFAVLVFLGLVGQAANHEDGTSNWWLLLDNTDAVSRLAAREQRRIEAKTRTRTKRS